jgi:hypothetical protein
LDYQSIKAAVIILALFFFLILQLFLSDSAYAQQEKPQVKVSVYLTEEKKACAPNGYPDKLRARENACEPLLYEKLESYEFGRPVYTSVPPECLPLGELAELIKEATQDCPIEKYCKDPKLRKAIVLVFYFPAKNSKGLELSLIREIPSRLEKYFNMDPLKGVYVAKGTLDQGGHWINHQRADLFLPDYGVKWILKVDEHIYKIGTIKNIKISEAGESECNEEY